MPKIDDALVYGDRRRLRQKTPPEGMRKAGLVQNPCGRPGGPEQCRCKNNLLQLAMLAVGPKTPAASELTRTTPFQTWRQGGWVEWVEFVLRLDANSFACRIPTMLAIREDGSTYTDIIYIYIISCISN